MVNNKLSVYALLLLLILSACSITTPTVKERTETYTTITTSGSRKEKRSYTKYDRKGRVIEKGEYGQKGVQDLSSQNEDGSISVIINHFIDYNKLSKLYHYQYNTKGKLAGVKAWQYGVGLNGKLYYSAIYQYDSLSREKYIIITKDPYVSGTVINENIRVDSSLALVKAYITSVEDNDTDLSYIDTIKMNDHQRKAVIHIGYDWYGYNNYKLVYDYNVDKNNYIETRNRYEGEHLDSLTGTEVYICNSDSLLVYESFVQVGFPQKHYKYKYNHKHLPKKVLYYNNDVLEGYTKYKYKYY